MSELGEWRLPQVFDTERVRRFRQAEWTADIMREIDAGGLQVLDRITGLPASPLQLPSILETAFKDISVDRGTGSGGGAVSGEMRVFRYQDADTWLRVNGKYGFGDGGIFEAMSGHLSSVARETASTRCWARSTGQRSRK